MITSLAAIMGCSDGGPFRRGVAAPDTPPPEVTVSAVTTERVREWDHFTGRVSAIGAVELRPRVSGYIERIAYAEGAEVRKGDVLFVIDPRPYRATLDQSQAQLERARAEAHLARIQDERGRALIHTKAISREEFDTRSSSACPE